MQRALFALGIIIALVGLAWPWISKLPLGRLPGDFLIERPGFRLFVPFTTMIVISLLITLAIAWGAVSMQAVRAAGVKPARVLRAD